MKNINKELFRYIISSIIITMVIIVMVYILVLNIMQNKLNKVFQTSNLIVDLNPNIDRKIEKLTDIDGINSQINKINITNTAKETINYEIILTPVNKDENYIRLDVDDLLIRTLNNFNKEDNNYILGNYSLPSGFTAIHQIKLWLDYSSSPYQSHNYKFKLTVKET